MWLFTTRGFYSAVQHREDPRVVLVRARARKDLERLLELPTFTTAKGDPRKDNPQILETPKADYPVRILVEKARWAAAMLDLGDEITYDNFKNAVKDRAPTKREGYRRSGTYMGVWSQMRKIEHEDREREEFTEPLWGDSDCDCGEQDTSLGPHHMTDCPRYTPF